MSIVQLSMTQTTIRETVSSNPWARTPRSYRRLPVPRFLMSLSCRSPPHSPRQSPRRSLDDKTPLHGHQKLRQPTANTEPERSRLKEKRRIGPTFCTACRIIADNDRSPLYRAHQDGQSWQEYGPQSRTLSE